ncbi:MAG: hypothetical protein ACXW1Z_22590 [Methylobacter sp.]
MVVGKGREHDCMDAGGRAPKVGALGDAGAVAEERKLFRQTPTKLAGNATSRYAPFGFAQDRPFDKLRTGLDGLIPAESAIPAPMPK